MAQQKEKGLSSAAVKLLRELVAADREYHSKIHRGDPAHRNDRGVEIAFGVKLSTALALVDAGLAEVLDPGINGRSFVFLHSYEPYDQEP